MMNDRAVERNNDEVLESLGGAGQKELDAIEAALARVASGHLRGLRQMRRVHQRGAAAGCSACSPLWRLHEAGMTLKLS